MHCPSRRKPIYLSREFSALMRMLPLEVMVPTTCGLSLALPASGARPAPAQMLAAYVLA